MRRVTLEQHAVTGHAAWLSGILLFSFSFLALPAGAKAEQLPVKVCTTADALANDRVIHSKQDSSGFPWFSTPEGLSRFNGNRLTTYGVKQGLTSPMAHDLLKTPQDLYWIATNCGGLCRFKLTAGFHTLKVSGVTAATLSSDRTGNGAPSPFEVYPAGDEQQTRLVGVLYSDRAGRLWAGIKGGLFRLEEANRQASLRRIELPFWQRWWSLMLAALLAGLAVYIIHRNRLARLVELERVRMRIATDLHDDIGASLSRIAILCEVAKQQNGHFQSNAGQKLTEIADTARNLVDSMSDIVWSVDPRRDDLRDLVLRIRQFASDVLDARAIQWSFEAPPEMENVKLTPDQRRHFLLIFKEAIHNIVRHSGCTSACLTLSIVGDQITAEIQDDGRGFSSRYSEQSAAENGRGHGLKNMRARATELGGRLNISSSPGQGTRLTVTAPI